MLLTISILIGSSVLTFSQKFVTLDQYKRYYIENAGSIHGIEGIWSKYTTFTFNTSVKDLPEEIVVIIREGTIYKQYTIENECYRPTPGTREFNNTISGFQYKRYNDNTEETTYGSTFSLYENNHY